MRHIALLVALASIGCHTSELRLGEVSTVGAREVEQENRWTMVVREVASMEGRVDGVEKVVIARDSVTIHFDRFDPLTRVARVFATVECKAEITAPDPAAAALAMTSGGFPPERIREMLKGDSIILRVLRARAVQP
ncbi:MAG TPA: hypothetical protein VM100_09580 [Longimicrobiales bacterium]|nr:hypothetical protein [Longimicrobiales bacterium]